MNSAASTGYELVSGLLEAAAAGDLQRLKASISKDGDLEGRDLRDKTALMTAADSGDLVAVNSLLELGAKPNAENCRGRTALMYAAYHQHAAILKALLAAGADPNITDHQTKTALDYALLKKEHESPAKECIAVLKSAGARPGGPALTGHRLAIRKALEGDQYTDFHTFKVAWHNLYFIVFCPLMTVVVGSSIISTAALFTSDWMIFFLLILCLTVFPLVTTVRKARELFPAITRFSHKLLSKRSPDALPGAAEEEQSPGVVQSPEFICAILERGQDVFIRWKKRGQLGAILASDRLDGILLSSSAIFLITVAASTVLPYGWARAAGLPELPVLDVLELLFPAGLPMVHYGWHLAVVILTVAFLEGLLRRRRLALAQRKVDGLAVDILELLDQETYSSKPLPPQFAVYLRPFVTTKRLYFEGTDLETLFAYSFLPYMPIIALGKTGEHFGAGRIETSDATWQKKIARMCQGAEVILCVPSVNEGTLWELNLLIRANLLDRTVFIMPPATRILNYAEEWEKIRGSVVLSSLHLPPYVPEGLVFRAKVGSGIEVYSPLRLERFVAITAPDLTDSGSGGDWNDASMHDGQHERSGHRDAQEQASAVAATGALVAGTALSHGHPDSVTYSSDLDLAWVSETGGGGADSGSEGDASSDSGSSNDSSGSDSGGDGGSGDGGS